MSAFNNKSVTTTADSSWDYKNVLFLEITEDILTYDIFDTENSSIGENSIVDILNIDNFKLN